MEDKLIFCPNCGTANRDGSNFCNECGQNLREVVQCSTCGSGNIATYHYCVSCGAQLVPANILDARLTPESVEPPESEVPKDLWTVMEEEQQTPIQAAPLDTPTPDETGRQATVAQPEEALKTSQPSGYEVGVTPPLGSVNREGLTLARSLATESTGVTAPVPEDTFSDPGATFLSVLAARSSGPTPIVAKGRGLRINTARLINLGLLVAVILPLFLMSPTTVPTVAASTRQFFDSIESLSSGSVVVVAYEWDAATLGEMAPLAREVTRHLFQRRLRVIAVSSVPQGPAFAQRYLTEMATAYDARYGVDYLNLGYLPGYESALALMATDFAQALPYDYALDGPSKEYALLEERKGLRDADLIIVLSGDEAHLIRWLQQVGARYPLKIAGATSAAAGPALAPYIQAKSPQLVGLVSGVRGAAEYASLLGSHLNYQVPTIRAQSLAIAFLVLLILAGNVVYLLSKIRGGGSDGRLA
ncbi:MAG: zinc ribbon domain-containing protein [Chloroflexi bacterium]|nr:zinc ribbon domain-containing protein [Chloroflexota bacterium]MCL5075062.1 zinc ribbon domain-containing protein [Chloroflexota bacterium]